MIGRAVADVLHARGESVFTTTRRSSLVSERCHFLDLERPVDDFEPDASVRVAFFCAGHNPSQCTQDPNLSYRVNVTYPRALMQRMERRGIFVVKLSSNAIFDGQHAYSTTTALHGPKSIYGRHHSEFDQIITMDNNDVAIVRFTKVIASGIPTFCGWLADLHADQAIRPLSDLYMSPISLPFIVNLIVRSGLKRQRGIFQASAAQDISYAEAALILVDKLNYSRSLVQPATMREIGIEQSNVPRHTTLDMKETIAAFGIQPPSINEAIDYLAEMAPMSSGVAG